MDQKTQQMLVAGLVAVAAVLAVIIGVLFYQSSQAGNIPAPTAASTAVPGATTQPNTAAQTPAQAPAAAPANTPFSAKTATKLPAGMTPQTAVETYNKDVVAGNYAAAYALLPTDKKASYGSVDAYGSQLKGYGITGYKIGKAVTTGKDVSIAAEQDTPQMPITYTWVFTNLGGTWYVKSRTMGGSVQ